MTKAASSAFRDLYQAWIDAIKRGDREWFERTLTDDFVFFVFLRDDDGVRRTVTLDKAEFISFDMLMVEIYAEVVEADAVVKGDLAISWLVADDRVVLGEPNDFQRAVMDKIEMTGDAARVTAEGFRGFYSTSWRREQDGWRAFSHELAGVLDA
jgi:ketosteroid isomerase-like protein